MREPYGTFWMVHGIQIADLLLIPLKHCNTFISKHSTKYSSSMPEMADPNGNHGRKNNGNKSYDDELIDFS